MAKYTVVARLDPAAYGKEITKKTRRKKGYQGKGEDDILF